MSEETTSGRRLWRLTTTAVVESGVAVLLMEGRLGHATAPELDAAASRLLGQGVLELVIDLSAVDYMSSGALRVIDALADDLARRGGRLTLRAPTVPARLALELAGRLNHVIE